MLAAALLSMLLALAGCASDDTASNDKASTDKASTKRAQPAMPNVVHGFAYAHGPIVGAQVSVLSDKGKPLARNAAQTEKGGTFFLRVPNLPANYRVVVQGGRHLGKPFKGELRAEVRGDTSEVVHASPVSTVVSHRVAQSPEAGLHKAETQVKRHLSIPAGLAVGDVRLNRRYFSGRAFMREADRHGGTAELAKTTARNAGSGADPHPYRGESPSRTAPGASATPDELLKSLLESAGSKISGDAAGWVLASLDKSLPLPESELDKIHRELVAINAQLTEIKAQLGEISQDLKQQGYNEIVDTLPLSKIDHVQGEIIWLITHPTSTDRKSVIETLVGTSAKAGYIESNLQDSPELFDRAFTGGFDRTKLVDAYGQVALKKSPNAPFFTPADNAKVFAAYDYYDLYLLLGLNSVVEWKHAKGETDRPKDLIEGVVANRKTKYEPTLPEKLDPNGVIDTRSRRQWLNQANFGLDFKQAAQRIRDYGGSWNFPSGDDFAGLLKDRGGQNPCDYLRPKGFDKALAPPICHERTPHFVAWGNGMEDCRQPGPQYPRFVKSLDFVSSEVTCTRYDITGILLMEREDGARYW